MLAFKLAFKNLVGAGLRTWLNVLALSFAFVVIIFYNGIIDGWNRQSRTDTQEWESGWGQYWTPGYDRYDPFTIRDSHQPLSKEVLAEVAKKNLVPVLLTQATAYLRGHMTGVILKGIDPSQTALKLPSGAIRESSGDTDYAIIGKRMAETCKLKQGDRMLIRWRDRNGTFDARELEIASVFKCDVPLADKGQVYLRLDVLQKMMGMENEATLLVTGKNYVGGEINDWDFKDQTYLLADMDKIIKTKK